MNKPRFVSLVLIGFLVAGCASQVERTSNMPASVPAKAGKVIYVSITAASEITSDSDYASSMKEFKSALSQKLQGVFPGTNVDFNRPPAGASSGQQMDITVLDFRYVSGSGRFWGGIFIGKARLQVRVRITDLQTGKLIGDSSMGTSSSSSEGIFGATSSRQFEAVSNAIVNMLGGGTNTSASQ